jgi:chemotaxis protein methyltransferase CheR
MPSKTTSLSTLAPALQEREFEQFRKLAYEKFGLNLTGAKQDLVASRLGKKLRELRLPSFRAYYDLVVSDKTGESLAAMIDALSTNHTLFLREAAHFDYLRQILLPALRKRSRIDVWSAPCSTGEEPYSIAMVLFNELGIPPHPPVFIRAVDISTKALTAARAGVYPAGRLAGLSPQQIKRYFRETEPGRFTIVPELRRAVEFERANLIEPLADTRLYPLIFCRNMMIYFDKVTQEKVVQQLARRLEPGGHLFIGHSESLMGARHPLEYIKPAIYRLPETRV